ncbi:hypothetical protein EZV62_017019 [Acer yangbiense]|uniref:Uncharacterized protein n=1 Tax=Acer yangbiense TaxID=1000413 RepID=A0A5C7HQ67_9ROSI|nr:hypothetical protein EZV62_017019 [Acer yangbiense]
MEPVALTLRSVVITVHGDESGNAFLWPGSSHSSTFHLIANFLWHRKPFYELGPLISLAKDNTQMSSQYAATTSTSISTGVHKKEVVHEQRNKSQHSQLSSSTTVKCAYCSKTQDWNEDCYGVFADRPDSNLFKKIFPDHYTHANVPWRILRCNLTGTAGVLYPRLKSYSHVCKRALDSLVDKLQRDIKCGQGQVYVKDHFRYAIFSMLVLRCYGDIIEECNIQEGVQYSRARLHARSIE